MKKVWHISLFVLSLLTIFPGTVHAIDAPAMTSPAGLSFAELKVTGDEFVVLQNNMDTPIADLSSYWLDNFNNVNPLAAGVGSSTQQLPPVSLDPGQRLLLSNAAMSTCGAAVAGKLNLSLTDGGGFLELVQMNQTSSGSVAQIPGDAVSWSSGSNGVIQNVPSNTKDPKAVFYRYTLASGFAWQQADLDQTNFCQLNVVVAGGSVAQTVSVTPLAAAAISPPATIQAASDSLNTPSGLPPADMGLLAPQLSEILPNPVGTGNDDTDEYVELYNPNKVSFDLTGFSLQVGTTATHTYTFPNGTSLKPQAFAAFYSSDTNLSLSNSGGQAVLLDPLGTSISKTEVYGTAKDGVAWAVKDGKWYWTTKPTPGQPNIITQPASATKKTTTKTAAKTTSGGKVKGASVATATTSAGQNTGNNTALAIPIHPWVLALIALAALLYGAYEYRTDLTNRINQFFTHRANRSSNR